MNVAKVTWNKEKDETKITFDDSFESSDWLVRVDILQDMIGTLQQQYNMIMSVKNWDERNKIKLNEQIN